VKIEIKGSMVLAENITVKTEGNVRAIEFDFLCPKCDRRHWARELQASFRRPFWFVGYGLECGWNGQVRMPWSKTPERDRLSVYGQV
jgi:hypothetical protein